MKSTLMTQSVLDVRGNWPKLANRALDALVLQEFWYQGTLEDEAMVCWIKAQSQWYRIYFDLGIAYCIPSETPPSVELSPEDLCECRFNDMSKLLGLDQAKVRQLCLDETQSSLRLTLELDSGVRFQLNHTRLRTEPSLSLS